MNLADSSFAPAAVDTAVVAPTAQARYPEQDRLSRRASLGIILAASIAGWAAIAAVIGYLAA